MPKISLNPTPNASTSMVSSSHIGFQNNMRPNQTHNTRQLDFPVHATAIEVWILQHKEVSVCNSKPLDNTPVTQTRHACGSEQVEGCASEASIKNVQSLAWDLVLLNAEQGGKNLTGALS